MATTAGAKGVARVIRTIQRSNVRARPGTSYATVNLVDVGEKVRVTVAAIEWFATRYVEYVKFKALAQATKRAHPVILKLSDWYTTSAAAVRLTELADANDEFGKAQEKFPAESPPTDAQIKAYVTAATKYDAALKAHAARPIEKFTVAHEKLIQELNGENGVTLADATAAIERLSNEAKAFKKVIGGFEKAMDTRGGN